MASAGTVYSDEEEEESRCSRQHPTEPDEVSCDVCMEENKVRALKSCLVCLTSYCETHLEPHHRVSGLRRHRLIDPVGNLEDMCVCRKHDRPLELFCKTDRACVCKSCIQSEEHRSHQIVSLEEECEGQKAELGKTKVEVQQMIRETQLKVQEANLSVEVGKKDLDREVAEMCGQFFAALMGRVEKQKIKEKQTEGFVKQLEREIAELKKRSSDVTRLLSHSEDHLYFLQNVTSSVDARRPIKDRQTAAVGGVPQPSCAGIAKMSVAQLEKTLGREMEKLYDAELKSIREYAWDITLDAETANPSLVLSDDGKQVSHGDAWRPLPDNAERFSLCHCVLGRQGFSSGRIYYQVRVEEKIQWYLGVARESVNRKEPLKLGPGNGFWTVGLKNGSYRALASPSVLLPVREEVVHTLGVFVDYEEGVVSFYDVEARAHLYSFTGCTFTEKLYPIFCPCGNYNGKNSAPLVISSVKHSD